MSMTGMRMGRQRFSDAVLGGDVEGQDHAAGRAGLDEADGIGDRRLHGRHATARHHQQQRADDAEALQAVAKPAQVSRHHRLDIGIGAGRRRPLVFADLRADLGGERDGHVRQRGAQDFADTDLMRRVDVAVQEADRDGFHLLRLQDGNERGDGVLVELQQYRSVRGDAFRHGVAPVARDERLRPFHVDVVLLEAVLVGDLDGVAKSVRRHQRRDRALALD
jgi:hypothetical protein